MRYFRTMHPGHKVVEGNSSQASEPFKEHQSRTVQEPVSEQNFPSNQTSNALFPITRDEPVAVRNSRQLNLSKATRIQVEMKEEIRPTQVEEALIITEPKREKNHRNQVSISRASTKIAETQPSLLLGKFSFVKEGEIYNTEAKRISNVLKAFRWKVEPPYVIGALFDDNLSIQSNTGVVSREMIMSIEQLGYNFIAVESPKGIMAAWFKKEGVQ